jgi:O-antigen/teichoic acid export membrane protein
MTTGAQSKKIVKNVSVMMVSQIITWALSFILMLYMARALGPETIGALGIAGAIWAIVLTLATFGSDVYLVKEVARHPEQTAEYITMALVLRVLFWIVGAVFATVYAFAMNYSQEVLYIFFLMALIQPFIHFWGVGQAGLQGIEAMGSISVATVISKLLTTVGSLAVLWMGYDVTFVLIVQLMSAIAGAFIIVYYLNKYIPITLKLNWKIAAPIIRLSWPYLMSAAVLSLYQQIDILVISSIVDIESVAWYERARGLCGTFMFLPSILMVALFPAITRSYSEKSPNLYLLTSRTVNLLFLIGVPVGLGLSAVSTPLIDIFYGAEFAPSAPVLFIMGFVLIVMYQNIAVGQFLIATDRQNLWTVVMLLATIATIPLDLTLVPWFQAQYNNGAIGGAISYLITEIGMTAFGFYMLPKGSLNSSTLRYGVGTMIAGGAMFAVAWYTSHLLIIIPIILGGIVYVGLILALRIMPPEDRELIQNLVLARLGRFNFRRKVAQSNS